MKDQIFYLKYYGIKQDFGRGSELPLIQYNANARLVEYV